MATSVKRLSDLSSYDHKFGMQDPSWRQTVYDHRLLIIKKAHQVEFTMEHAHRWRFRLQEFMKLKYNLPYDAFWIVCLINNFQNIDCDGGTIDVLFPDLSHLEELYTGMLQTSSF